MICAVAFTRDAIAQPERGYLGRGLAERLGGRPCEGDRAQLALRITDRLNGASSGDGVEAGTVEDFLFNFAVPCAATSDDSGSACAVTTSANALQPGSVRDGARAIWETRSLSLLDADGTMFATEALFAP